MERATDPPPTGARIQQEQVRKVPNAVPCLLLHWVSGQGRGGCGHGPAKVASAGVRAQEANPWFWGAGSGEDPIRRRSPTQMYGLARRLSSSCISSPFPAPKTTSSKKPSLTTPSRESTLLPSPALCRDPVGLSSQQGTYLQVHFRLPHHDVSPRRARLSLSYLVPSFQVYSRRSVSI